MCSSLEWSRVEKNCKIKKYKKQQPEYHWNHVGYHEVKSEQEEAQEMKDIVWLYHYTFCRRVPEILKHIETRFIEKVKINESE